MSSPAESLRAQWRGASAGIGLWHRLAVPTASAIVGRAGFDWVCIDLQHGSIGYHEEEAMLRALAAAGTPAIVRIPWHDPGQAMKALDAGAHGVLVPVIHDAIQAREMVRACRHPPHGYRSWAGKGLGDTPQSADGQVVCGVMIETREAVSALDEILSIEGLDFVFVGPDDLAISCGVAPSLTPSDPDLIRTIEYVAARSRERAVGAGIYCGSARMAAYWFARGYHIFAATSDESVLRAGLADAVGEMRQALAALG